MEKSDIKTLTIAEIKRKFDNNQIDFNPSYQRKSGVWRENKKLLLIDSILSGYIIPTIYFRSKNGDPDVWEIVDGSQRLSVIREYLYDNKAFNFGKFGIDKYRHYDGKTWNEFIEMGWPEILSSSRDGGDDIKRMKEFKLTYVEITSASDEEMIDIFRRLNSSEPLSDGEWLTCLLPSLPLWEITKEFSDFCYNKYSRIIYNQKKNGNTHEDFDPLRNMDAWFWANVSLVVYQYEVKGNLNFINGKKSIVCDDYEKLQKEYAELSENEQQKNKELCQKIKVNMMEGLKLFIPICHLMRNEFKRPKALFAAFIYSYMNRNNSALINNLKHKENQFAKRIRLFAGEKINIPGNEPIIEYTQKIVDDYKKIANNTSTARHQRYLCFERLLKSE